MTSPLAKEQERLRQMARQQLRTARRTREDIIYNPFSAAAERAQANADWYAQIQKAASDGILTPGEIQQTAILSRQRYWQITRRPTSAPATPKPTEVHLPETDV